MSDVRLREVLLLILRTLSLLLRGAPAGPQTSGLSDGIANEINELTHQVPAWLEGETSPTEESVIEEPEQVSGQRSGEE